MFKPAPAHAGPVHRAEASPATTRPSHAAGVPVLLTRGADGVVRGFYNICSHRAAVLVPEGNGSARRFSCPYHAWTYDQEGALVGILSREDFGDVDAGCLGLVELPVAERAGLIWAQLSPTPSIDIDTFLCGYDELLGAPPLRQLEPAWSRQQTHPRARTGRWPTTATSTSTTCRSCTGTPSGRTCRTKAIYDAWGPHQRVSSRPGLRQVPRAGRQAPRPSGPTPHLTGGVWTIFPHVSIAAFDSSGRGVYMVSQLFPGAERGRRRYTIQSYFLHHLAERPPRARWPRSIAERMAFNMHVVAGRGLLHRPAHPAQRWRPAPRARVRVRPQRGRRPALPRLGRSPPRHGPGRPPRPVPPPRLTPGPAPAPGGGARVSRIKCAPSVTAAEWAHEMREGRRPLQASGPPSGFAHQMRPGA